MARSALSFAQYDQTALRLPPQGQRFPQYREVLVTSLHTLSPSDKSNKPEGLGMDTTLTGRTPRVHRNERVTADYTAERVKFALQAWGKEKSAPIERVRQIAGVDRKTAAAWYNGKTPPRSEHLFTLALKIPELKAELRRLLELEQDHAESFQREAIALLQRYAR